MSAKERPQAASILKHGTSCTTAQSRIVLIEFALLLGVKPSSLAYVLYKIPTSEKYTQFSYRKEER